MSYDWPRIHKAEDNFYAEISDVVCEHVLTHYGVDEIEDLTQEQIDEVDTYRSCQLGEYSVMQVGYSNLINHWESQ